MIEADLSRQDVVVLHELCAGKTVVEFGAGGSTVFLAKIASHLVSYEPDEEWRNLASARLAAEPGFLCPHSVLACRNVPPIGAPRFDVYFVDGPRSDRVAWVNGVLKRRLARIVVVHDSRRAENMRGFGGLIEEWLPWMARIDAHPRDSNLLVMHVRREPVKWRNWNLEETANRAPHLHLQK